MLLHPLESNKINCEDRLLLKLELLSEKSELSFRKQMLNQNDNPGSYVHNI